MKDLWSSSWRTRVARLQSLAELIKTGVPVSLTYICASSVRRQNQHRNHRTSAEYRGLYIILRRRRPACRYSNIARASQTRFVEIVPIGCYSNRYHRHPERFQVIIHNNMSEILRLVSDEDSSVRAAAIEFVSELAGNGTVWSEPPLSRILTKIVCSFFSIRNKSQHPRFYHR
jgi:hypothetical protein